MRMGTKTPTSILLLVHPSLDDDYVKAFQDYSKLREKSDKRGARTNDSLRLSILQSAMNNHGMALEHAKDAIVSSPSSRESKYQLAASYVLAAYAKSGCIENIGTLPMFKDLREPLQFARENLESILHYEDGDADAEALLALVDKTLEDCSNDGDIRKRFEFDAKLFK